MKDDAFLNQCTDPNKSLTIEIPCALAERVDRHAADNDTTVSGVIIEALDTFLRSRSN